MSAITEPVPQPLAWGLRREVLDLRRRQRRRRFPPRLLTGVPGSYSIGFEDDTGGELDQALRVEIAAVLLERATSRDPAPMTWLTRPGDGTQHALDLLWLPAVWSAYAEAGIEARVVVVTRFGWHDSRSGVARRWLRLRQR